MENERQDEEEIGYPVKFEELNSFIERCFLEEPGPGTTPAQRDNDEKTIGYIVPCDSYETSGYCAAWAYKRIAETSFKDVYIIISHNDSRESKVILSDWDSPLGVVRTYHSLGEELNKLTNISISKADKEKDKLIQRQIPLLQYASRDKLNSLRVLCISLGKGIEKEQIYTLSSALKRILKEQNKEATFICASNLVHYGERFGYVPFVYNIKESIEDLDYHAIEIIEQKDESEFVSFVEKERTTIYGYKAIALFLCLVDKSTQNKMLEYYKSDIFNKRKRVEESVSYLSYEFL
ncbi:MAG: AmmeMemoRadiSam system protein B [Nanoarchaeota archaeon]